MYEDKIKYSDVSQISPSAQLFSPLENIEVTPARGLFELERNWSSYNFSSVFWFSESLLTCNCHLLVRQTDNLLFIHQSVLYYFCIASNLSLHASGENGVGEAEVWFLRECSLPRRPHSGRPQQEKAHLRAQNRYRAKGKFPLSNYCLLLWYSKQNEDAEEDSNSIASFCVFL